MVASGARISLALLSGAALQAAALGVEDLEEERGSAVILEVDREGAPRTADQCDLPQPRVMKILPAGTVSISAPVAGALQSVCCNQSSRGPLGGISAKKKEAKRIQVLEGIAAHSTNSREEFVVWTPGAATRATAAR